MFTLQIFTEILVIGVLLLLGALPLLPLVVGKDRRAFSLLFAGNFDSKLPMTFVLLVVAYAIGAAGNRLVDSLWDEVPNLESDHRCGDERKPVWCTNEEFNNRLLIQYLSKPTPTPGGEQQTPPADKPKVACTDPRVGKVNCIKAAEFALRERDDSTREWFDNRRTYIRIMRAASFAALLLFFSMGVCEAAGLVSRRRAGAKADEGPAEPLIDAKSGLLIEMTPRPERTRYRLRHFLAAAVLFGIFSWANFIADEKYWQRVYEVYVTLPSPAQTKGKG